MIDRIQARKPYVGIIAAAGRGSRYNTGNSHGAVKQLERVDPYSNNPLRRTVLGRLVDQLHSTAVVDRVLVITGGRHAEMEEYFKSYELAETLASKRIRVDLRQNPDPGSLSHSFQIGKEYLGAGEKAIVLMGDFFLPDANITKAVDRTFRLGPKPFLFMMFARFAFMLGVVPKYDVCCYVTNQSLLELAAEAGLEREGEVRKFLRAGGFQRMFSHGHPFVNINTPEALEKAFWQVQGGKSGRRGNLRNG